MIETGVKVGIKPLEGSCTVLKDGRLFYVSLGSTPFNLPPGTGYEILGKWQQIEPVKYPLHRLPAPDRQMVDKVTIEYGNTPHKAYIVPSTGKIVIDSVFFAGLTYTQKCYVTQHEIGHLIYYKNPETREECADIFAENSMLERGFNPSQIYEANATLISNADERIETAVFRAKKFRRK